MNFTAEDLITFNSNLNRQIKNSDVIKPELKQILIARNEEYVTTFLETMVRAYQ